jgi:hypothetical protein
MQVIWIDPKASWMERIAFQNRSCDLDSTFKGAKENLSNDNWKLTSQKWSWTVDEEAYIRNCVGA